MTTQDRCRRVAPFGTRRYSGVYARDHTRSLPTRCPSPLPERDKSVPTGVPLVRVVRFRGVSVLARAALSVNDASLRPVVAPPGLH